jgi:hypothetical protein
MRGDKLAKQYYIDFLRAFENNKRYSPVIWISLSRVTEEVRPRAETWAPPLSVHLKLERERERLSFQSIKVREGNKIFGFQKKNSQLTYQFATYRWQSWQSHLHWQ